MRISNPGKRAFDRLRGEKVVLLTLDLGSELLDAVDNRGQILKDESPRCIRIAAVKLCNIMTLAAGNIDQQRGIRVSVRVFEQDIIDVEEVEPLLAICTLAGHKGVEVAHHQRVFHQPREHVVLRIMGVLEGAWRPIDVLEPCFFEVKWHIG